MQEKPLEALLDNQVLGENELLAKVEALIFASEKPLTANDLFDIFQDETITIRQIHNAIKDLQNLYQARVGGIFLQEDQDRAFHFRTRKEMSEIVERMYMKKPRPLSRAAQETLAIVAYRQPTTRAEIEFIRGVDAGSIIKNLLERDMISCVGRKEIAGRPMLFATTDEFLRVYNLRSLADLPSIDSFQPQKATLKTALSQLEAEDFDHESEEESGPIDLGPSYSV